MSLDYSALCLQFIYDILASDMELDDGTIIPAIDKTSGISVPDAVGIETIKPAAAVKMITLADNNLTIDDLLGTTVTLNAKSWKVISHKPSPGINGEDDGEVFLMLEEAD